jgi:hypothetical protein
VRIAVLPENETINKLVKPQLFALCTDGTIWGLPLEKEMTTKDWCQLPSIPQPEA